MTRRWELADRKVVMRYVWGYTSVMFVVTFAMAVLRWAWIGPDHGGHRLDAVPPAAFIIALALLVGPWMGAGLNCLLAWVFANPPVRRVERPLTTDLRLVEPQLDRTGVRDGGD